MNFFKTFLAGTFIVLSLATSAFAQEAGEIKQIKLTDAQMQAFIAAQKEMAAIDEKMEKLDADKPDAKVMAELEAQAKKLGFSSFGEYNDVVANVSMIASGIDPEKKTFTQPPAMIQQEIDAVKADTKMKKAEKDEVLKELAEALKTTKPVQFPENIELVKKYYDKIDHE